MLDRSGLLPKRCREQGDPGISLTLRTIRFLRFGFRAPMGTAVLEMHRADPPPTGSRSA